MDKGEGVKGEREPPAFSNYFKHWSLVLAMGWTINGNARH